MKVSDIIKQLYATLPFNISKFNDGVGITQIVFNGLVATVTTDKSHDLNVNDTCTIIGLYSPIDIATIARTADKLLITTTLNHDFTDGFQTQIEIDGATEPEFNGTFQIIKVIDSNNIIAQTVDSGATVSTGAPFLKQFTGSSYNQIIGYKIVLTVPTINSFTFALITPLNATISSLGSIATGYRITGAVDFQSALQMYTSADFTDEFWAFVSSGSNIASKDRKNNSDAIYVYNRNTGYKQEINQTFSVFVFTTASEEIDAYPIKDEMQDVAAALIKSLCGFRVESGFSVKDYFSIVFDTHLTQFYNKGIYVHNFIFQTSGQINQSDIFDPETDVAITDIDLSMNSIVKDFEIKPNTQTLDAHINL